MHLLSNGILAADPQTFEGFEGELTYMKTVQKKPFNDEEVRGLLGGVEGVWVVGDRLMTDVYLANRMGCKSILL